MTLERASELVKQLEDLRIARRDMECTAALDLFGFFVDTFQISGKEALEEFASLCGFAVVSGVRTL